MKMKSLFLFLFFFPFVLFGQGTKKKKPVIKNREYVLNKGVAAPPFSLLNQKGETISLADFKGKILYMDFWGEDCEPCIADIKNDVTQLHDRDFQTEQKGAPLLAERAVGSANTNSPDQPSVGGVPEV